MKNMKCIDYHLVLRTRMFKISYLNSIDVMERALFAVYKLYLYL